MNFRFIVEIVVKDCAGEAAATQVVEQVLLDAVAPFESGVDITCQIRDVIPDPP